MTRMTKAVLVPLVVLGLCSLARAGQVIYVDDATGADDGSSWANAYTSLPYALDHASYGDEIRVAQGTYRPNDGVITIGDERELTFQLKNGVTVKGGYAGFGEADPDARDIELYETILSGDLNGDDIEVTDPVDMQCDPSRQENSYNVVTGSGTDATAIFDGFTIIAGHNTDRGGGMNNYEGSPTINNCTFKWNTSEWGGGMCNRNNSSPTVNYCTFSSNSGQSGGGMYNAHSSPTVTNCTFDGNWADWFGGGIGTEVYSSSVITDCVFRGNSSGDGGGVYVGVGAATLTNCLFSGNSAERGGGAYYNNHPLLTITNCTFNGNTATNDGGGIGGEGSPIVTNCILWGNTPGGMYVLFGNPVLSYCDIQGDWSGTGNIDADPLFADADGPDSVVGTEDDDLRLLPGSPCINAGDNSVVTATTDMDGNERIVNTFVDMGAYELQGMPMIYFVDADATGTEDGSSWADAYTSLSYALDHASYGNEIRVAQGTYRPNDGVITIGDERELTFQLKNRVTVKGGYAGFGESDPDARDVELYETILSGDLNGDDIEVTDPVDIWDDPSRQDNSYNVVTGSGTDATAIFDGFSIIAGYNTGSGGGMNNYEGSPTINNCTFKWNTSEWGGGMCNSNNSSPTVSYCTFSSNNGQGGGGMDNTHSSPTINNCTFKWNTSEWGGAMSNRYSSSPTLNNCIFSNNYSQVGGGMNNYYSSPTLTNCTFSGNLAYGAGGGISNAFASPTITNCRFIKNTTSYSGGAMDNGASGGPIVTNCLFVGNSADCDDPNWGRGGAIANDGYDLSSVFANCTFYGNTAKYGGAIHCSETTSTIVNSILWGNIAVNGPEIAMSTAGSGTSLSVFYSIVQGGEDGVYDKSFLSWDTSNIDFDPLFVDPNGPDGVAGTEDDDLGLSADSLCIDSGDNSVVTVTTDLDGNARIFNNFVDMGAYEFSGVHIIYVDDDAPGDPDPSDSLISDPLENGTAAHPFDSILEAMNMAKDGHTVMVRGGLYTKSYPDKIVYFQGTNITVTSLDPTDPDIVNDTVIAGEVMFSGLEDPSCLLTGFKIQSTFFGVIQGHGTHATISNCIISGNGPCLATVINDFDGLISNCVITDNTTFALCGVMPVVFNCNGVMRNCTIANNISGIGDWEGGSMTLENCIVYNNGNPGEPQIGISGGGMLDVSYCNVEDGLAGVDSDGPVNWGMGNIDVDPEFVRWGVWDYDTVELDEGNYHLKSYGWRLSEYDAGWTYDLVTSRCIDAGNPGSPLGDELMSVPRDPDNNFGINLRVNMGAYGGARQASMAPYGWAILGDLNNDGTIGHEDMAGQVEGWLMSASDQSGDLNRDGIVDMVDFAALAEDWMVVTDWAN